MSGRHGYFSKMNSRPFSNLFYEEIASSMYLITRPNLLFTNHVIEWQWNFTDFII